MVSMDGDPVGESVPGKFKLAPYTHMEAIVGGSMLRGNTPL